MYNVQEFHRYQETRHRENMTRAERATIREFWRGFAWASVLHWVALALVLAVLAPSIRQAIEYAGSVAAIQEKVEQLPMMEKNN